MISCHFSSTHVFRTRHFEYSACRFLAGFATSLRLGFSRVSVVYAWLDLPKYLRYGTFGPLDLR
jgi:hypothetical protein